MLLIDDRYASMPWDELDAIVFDIGNVLLRFDPDALLERYFPAQPELQSELKWRVFQSPYWALLDYGKMTQEEAIAAMTLKAPHLSKEIANLMNSWINLDEVVPEGLEALRLCKEKGKRVYILSNYPEMAFDFIQPKHDFFKEFDGIVVSSYIKMAKPRPDIFEHLLKTYHLTPERTLFIDDLPGNIAAAMLAGMQGLCLNYPGRLRTFMTSR